MNFTVEEIIARLNKLNQFDMVPTKSGGTMDQLPKGESGNYVSARKLAEVIGIHFNEYSGEYYKA